MRVAAVDAKKRSPAFAGLRVEQVSLDQNLYLNDANAERPYQSYWVAKAGTLP